MLFLAMVVGKGLTKEVSKQWSGEEKEDEGGAGC